MFMYNVHCFALLMLTCVVVVDCKMLVKVCTCDRKRYVLVAKSSTEFVNKGTAVYKHC